MRQRSNLLFALSVLLIIVAAVWFWQRRQYVTATIVGNGVVRATATGGLGVQLDGTTQFVQLEKPLFGAPAEGAPVRVRYFAADADGSSATPPAGRIDSAMSLWLGPSLVLLGALLLLLAGAASALSQRRRAGAAT